MSYTKTILYNLSLQSLLLAKEVTNADTDQGNEVRILNMWWETAFYSTLKDLDLDSLSIPITLELITELSTGPWTYVYKYPTNCAKFRRITSGHVIDNKNTLIAKRVGQHKDVITQLAIYTNQYQAIAECIPKDISLAALSPMAAVAISKRLATLAAPLLAGKGAGNRIRDLEAEYLIAKMEAQQDDAEENFNYEDESLRSEFVNERIS